MEIPPPSFKYSKKKILGREWNFQKDKKNVRRLNAKIKPAFRSDCNCTRLYILIINSLASSSRRFNFSFFFFSFFGKYLSSRFVGCVVKTGGRLNKHRVEWFLLIVVHSIIRRLYLAPPVTTYFPISYTSWITTKIDPSFLYLGTRVVAWLSGEHVFPEVARRKYLPSESKIRLFASFKQVHVSKFWKQSR